MNEPSSHRARQESIQSIIDRGRRVKFVYFYSHLLFIFDGAARTMTIRCTEVGGADFDPTPPYRAILLLRSSPSKNPIESWDNLYMGRIPVENA